MTATAPLPEEQIPFMNDTGDKKPLGLRPSGSRPGNVKQSFSHGRTKNVVVETKARKRVVATPPASLKPQVPRITFSKTLLNAAALVLVLVTGSDKAERLAEVLDGPSDPERLPAQLIAPAPGQVVWLVDRLAAAQLR